MLKAALYKDESLWAEVLKQSTDAQEFRLWWLGQSGFLLQWQGKRVLFDPYLSDSLTRKYAQSTKPHVRISERVIAPTLLQGINILTSSHNHTDQIFKQLTKTNDKHHSTKIRSQSHFSSSSCIRTQIFWGNRFSQHGSGTKSCTYHKHYWSF